MNMLLLAVTLLFSCVYLSNAATCGSERHFEYKFTPLKVGPVKDADKDNAHGRCGSSEKHCEVVVQLYGEEKCKDKHDHAIVMMSKVKANQVRGNQLEPSTTGWKTHADWSLSASESTPFSITVCDKDSGFRGGNDEIINVNLQRLNPGCNEYRNEDTDPKHPWFIEYELCCRALH